MILRRILDEEMLEALFQVVLWLRVVEMVRTMILRGMLLFRLAVK